MPFSFPVGVPEKLKPFKQSSQKPGFEASLDLDEAMVVRD
jgi:hypothetical protein